MAETYVDLPILESAFVDSKYPESNFPDLTKWSFSESSGGSQFALIKFQTPESAISGKRLYRIEVRGNYIYGAGITILHTYWNNSDFIPGLVTWNSKPKQVLLGVRTRLEQVEQFTSFAAPDAEYWEDLHTPKEISYESSFALYGNGIAINARINYHDGRPVDIYSNGLVMRVYYDDSASATSQVTVSNAPTSGYVNPRTATSFSWGFIPSGTYYPVSPWSQRSGTLFWRQKGASTWNQIAAGTAQNVTVAANTFPTASTIQWYVSATDTNGTTSNTPTYEFSTAAGAVSATPVSPADSVEDNSAAITFTWNVTSADGQAQSSSELQYSTNGSSWTALGTVSWSGTSYVCPANTLPSGTLYWRVRASNIDGTAGAWSSPVSFVSFGAPAAPSVTVQAGGFAIVNWQAEVQEAYRIIIDGKTIGPFFGKNKSYHFEDYLEIGQHTVSIELQNSFGIWSQPGTATFTVEKSVYAAPIVNRKPGKVGIDVYLIIENPNAASGYVTGLYLYRDGKKIASLDPSIENQTYTDRFVLGKHLYRVVARYLETDASYNDQVEGVIAEAIACCPMIAPFGDGEWMKLRLSETTRRTEGFTKQRQISLRHFTGAEYPVAEVSPYTDASGSYDCAFESLEDANAFESLFGQVVILKTKANNVVIGVLSNYEKRVSRHYIAYTFTIQRIYWRDYLDLTTD